MTTAAANTIHVNGPRGQREELKVASGQTIKPGMLVKVTSANEVTVHASAGSLGATLLVHEDEFQDSSAESGGVTKTYAVGSPCFVEYVLPGAVKYVLLKASENVAIGDPLGSDGTGLFVKRAGTPVAGTKDFFIAEEASNTGSNQLIKARAI